MQIKKEAKALLKEASSTTFTLLKIMIPVSIIVKILAEFGLIEVIGKYLSPIMELVGLPGDYGLVWATAMLTNLYGGMVAYFNIVLENPLSIAQVTILATMLLVAHNLPIELRIAQKSGTKIWFIFLLRVLGAFTLGFLMNLIFIRFNLLQSKSVLLWSPASVDPSIQSWILGEIKNYVIIFLIIFTLLLLMKILKKIGAIKKLNNFIEPGLEFIGMSKNAAPLAIIGTTLGLAYGGGLIIKEAKSGNLTKKDVFLSLSFMSLSHSLIEDTFLMLAIGASILGIFFGRIIFAIIVMLILIQIIKKISKKTFSKYLISKS